MEGSDKSKLGIKTLAIDEKFAKIRFQKWNLAAQRSCFRPALIDNVQAKLGYKKHKDLNIGTEKLDENFRL